MGLRGIFKTSWKRAGLISSTFLVLFLRYHHSLKYIFKKFSWVCINHKSHLSSASRSNYFISVKIKVIFFVSSVLFLDWGDFFHYVFTQIIYLFLLLLLLFMKHNISIGYSHTLCLRDIIMVDCYLMDIWFLSVPSDKLYEYSMFMAQVLEIIHDQTLESWPSWWKYHE